MIVNLIILKSDWTDIKIMTTSRRAEQSATGLEKINWRRKAFESVSGQLERRKNTFLGTGHFRLSGSGSGSETGRWLRGRI